MKIQDCVFLDIAVDSRMALNVRGASHETFSYGCNDLCAYSFLYLLTLNLCTLGLLIWKWDISTVAYNFVLCFYNFEINHLPKNQDINKKSWGKIYLYFWVYRSKRYKLEHREEE